MPLRAVENTSLADKVFEQLTTEIVSGAYDPGDTIPSERALSDIFGVNRHVVREAVKRLEQVGLVKVSQGGGTRVLDFRRTAGLDLLAVLAEHAEALEALLPLAVSALEMRAAIGADVARLCALRADEITRGELQMLAERLALSTRAELFAVDQLFWEEVLAGAHNLAYQLAFNSLIRGVHAIPDVTLPLLEHELRSSDHRRPIAAAIAAGDADLAERVTREALEPARDLITTFTTADMERKRASR
jgi:DNA-binding FadR family transcriptional regulator